MKTKFLLIFLALIGGSFAANAQITTGNPTSQVIKTGNRAEAGNFGLYIGATSTMFRNIFNGGTDMQPLPLLNFKYMATDKIEARLGLEAYKLSEKLNGEIPGENNLSVVTSKNKYGESTLMLYPGFAYHFSKLNILDVYVGAELPLGWDARTSKTTNSDFGSIATTKKSFVLGLGAFVGLQAFIADLPLAIGLEYGLSSRLDTGLKYKTVSTYENSTTTIYTSDASKFEYLESDESFSKLAARRGEIGGQLRVTLSYYFK